MVTLRKAELPLMNIASKVPGVHIVLSSAPWDSCMEEIVAVLESTVTTQFNYHLHGKHSPISQSHE